jgi:DNA polymerase
MRRCPDCLSFVRVEQEWGQAAIEQSIELIRTETLECLEYYHSDSLKIMAGCLRSLFIAKPRHELICSDYSAIEAVVLAALAGERWRLDVFKTHGKIYELSASKISGVPFEEFEQHRIKTGNHHPLRKKLGKVAELASGYSGWIGAWKQFGAGEFYTDDEIKESILRWRAESPAIVNFWGGQSRNRNKEFFGLEGAAISAILNPGYEYRYLSISYQVLESVLYCRLPSGRFIVYHQPRLIPSTRRPGEYTIVFKGANSNPKMGKIGWVDLETYGGKLTENVVQAVARDILANAIINLEDAGYPVVLHVHDEIIAEVPRDTKSLEEFEQIMSKMPDWAHDWPVKAQGGWRGERYRK